jgi:CubicO group peptidase (beta-lactamase class C family)
MRQLVLVIGVLACGNAKEPRAPKARLGDLGVDIASLTAQLPKFIDSVSGGDERRAMSGYVLVAQHDQVIWSGAYGLADREKQRVPTANTSFRVGSVTKQFTAAAVLRLEQDGKLSVDDKVGRHLPEYPGPGKDVTIHQLLTHTAGVPNFTQDPAILARKAERWTTRQLLELFWDKPLEFEPGTKFQYSNGGYAVLGAIIEKASGMTYARYVADKLFAPAGMKRSVVGDAAGDDDRAEGYRIDGKTLAKADPIDMSLPFAAGAVRSTASDLVRWHRALMGDTVLGAAARDKLYRVAKDGYAYGWMVQELRGKRTVWHNGGIDGFHTIYWRVPEADLVVVAWSNVQELDVDPVGHAAVEAALGGKLKLIEPANKVPVDAALVARVVGMYALPDDTKAKLAAMKLPKEIIDTILTIEVTASEGGVTIKPNGQGAVELAPAEGGGFFDAAHGIRLRLELPASGPVQTIVLEQGPLAIPYRRK